MAEAIDSIKGDSKTWPGTALGCGVLGVISSVWIYWMVVPGLVFGLLAIALGWRARRHGALEIGSIAITLGIVAVLLVPSVLVQIFGAEEWGRDCALDPNHDPHC